MITSELGVKSLFRSITASTSSIFEDEVAVVSGDIYFEPIASPVFVDCCISVVCESGTADIVEELGPFHLTPMTSMSIMPGHIVTSWSLSDFRGTIVLMSSQFVEDVLGYYVFPLREILNSTRVERVPSAYVDVQVGMSSLFNCICEFGGSRCRESIVLLFKSIVSGFAPIVNIDKLPSGNSVVRQFIRMLDVDSVQVKSLAFYAEKMGVSSGYLSAILKNATGRSFPEWISSAVIHRAKLLLLNPNLTIKEISYNLGFGDPSNFARYFKSYCGMTPKEFRGMMPEGRGKSILDY